MKEAKEKKAESRRALLETAGQVDLLEREGSTPGQRTHKDELGFTKREQAQSAEHLLGARLRLSLVRPLLSSRD